MRIVLPLKKTPQIRSDSRAIKKDEFHLSKSKFYWEKSSTLDANFANTAEAATKTHKDTDNFLSR
jgi:hypothetical protein